MLHRLCRLAEEDIDMKTLPDRIRIEYKGVCVCARARARVSVCVRVCVCVRERERERERVNVKYKASSIQAKDTKYIGKRDLV